jgi:hypothetical protein
MIGCQAQGRRHQGSMLVRECLSGQTGPDSSRPRKRGLSPHRGVVGVTDFHQREPRRWHDFDHAGSNPVIPKINEVYAGELSFTDRNCRTHQSPNHVVTERVCAQVGDQYAVVGSSPGELPKSTNRGGLFAGFAI